MQKSKKQNTFIITIFLLSLVALFLAFKNFFLDIIKFQIANNTEGMTNYIIDKGIIAPILIVGIEAMQMICVFISVDFLQTAIGMTYPWYIAALICLIGVTLGSIIIYFLVHFLKFDSSMFKKNYKKVKIIDKKNTQTLMYLLFITPIVPLGFVCYYGATQKISFRRYLFTCITGALPDIIVAVALGNFIKYALINDLPIWAIVLIVLCALGLLFLLCGQLFKRFQKYSGKGTPNSRVYTTLFTIFKTITKNKPVYDISQTFDFDGPFIILSNHPSFYDVYYICETIDPIRPAFILNRFYFRNKWFKKILNRMGTIPKRIFQPDIETIKKSMKTIKNGYPVYMCPEGRLSVDGTNYEITIETPKGNIKFNLESLKELTKYLLQYPDYTGVRAKQLKKEKK